MLNKIKNNKFRTILIAALLCLFVFVTWSNQKTILTSENNIVAEENVNAIPANSEQVVKVFFSPYCPHCHHLNNFIDAELKDKYPSVAFEMHDISDDAERQVLRQYLSMSGLDPNRIGTPTVFVGADYLIGFRSPETTGVQLINLIDKNFFDKETAEKKTLK